MRTFIIFATVLVLLQTTYAQSNFQTLQGPYLGQTTPGDKAEIFAPGIICTTLNERDITFSPDLKEIIFGVLEKPYCVFVSVKYINGKWSTPELLPFCGKHDDVEPQLSPDGNRLYFSSDRPVNDSDSTDDYDIWYVDRTDTGWSEPCNVGSPVNSDKNEYYPSITKNGTLYFTTHDMKICKSVLTDNGFSERIILIDSINSGVAEYNAFIAPDESYLIFTSHGWEGGRAGRGDLFISFNKGKNEWTSAVNLGPKINSKVVDLCPTVTPDGKYFFFSSTRVPSILKPEPITSYEEIFQRSNTWGNGKSDIYWVSAEFIQNIKSITK